MDTIGYSLKEKFLNRTNMKTQEEIEKLANEFSKDYIKTTNNSILQSSFKLEVGYIKGYNKCQEDMADNFLSLIEEYREKELPN